MTINEDNHRLNVTVTKDFTDEIDKYAKKFNLSRSKMCERLVLCGLANLEAYDYFADMLFSLDGVTE